MKANLRILAFSVAASVAPLLSLAAYAQTPAALDCEGLGSAADPRCQAAMRTFDQIEQDARPGRTIPVIRDQASPPAGRLERQTAPQPAASRLRTPLPPDPPTEFQEFARQSTGKLLTVFGANLFRDTPSTFAPADLVPAAADYELGPGDQLLIRGWGQIALNLSPVVDSSGAVYIPQVGDLNVAGLRFAQIHDYLKAAIGRVYRNFELSVNLGQLRSIQVFVVGRARQPGVYTVSSLSTLVNAVFASGGPSPSGSMRRLQLIRDGNVISDFDLYDLLLKGDRSNDRRLAPGDVISIAPVGPQVALTGSVNAPGIYELKEGCTLADALQLGGGLTPLAAPEKTSIERTGNSSRHVVQVSLTSTAASSAKLFNGDIINIPAIVPRFENTVTLRGNVADPIRMPWHPGMRIRDLIPDREALLTRDYWRIRDRLSSSERPRSAADDRGVGGSLFAASPDSKAGADRESRLAGTGPSVPTDRGITAGTESETRVAFSRSTPVSIAVAGTQEPPAENRIERNPFDVNWNYAVVERLDPEDLSTVLVPFRLGKAILDGDETENLPLQPGDVVTVFSISDLKVPQTMQARYVRLEGEFLSAGTYSVRPGETLRQLVKRAGGLTPQAYLPGSEFLRQSSRLEQQQRLDDLVNTLERQVASAAANVRGSVISPEEAAAASSQITGQRELVEKLRRLRATGRIVLDLDPRGPGVEALPDLSLEDGDRFAVPSRPAFINVVGSVQNGTSFLYQEGRRLRDYLREAGGPGRTGDARHAFLIRADGSVVSKSWGGGLLSRSFESLPLNPGDTIVVPEQINKTTFLKGLKDWSQVFAQFGLGAAAINILR